MIRASKQVVPKNKVVDHLVLYNFYFDRDSSANMKFGVLDGQNLIKNTQTRYCAPCFCHGDGVQSRRCHASRAGETQRRLSSPLPLRSPSLILPPRSSFLARAEHAAEPSPSRPPPAFVPAKLATPSRFPAPQPSSPHPAPPTPLSRADRPAPRPNRPPDRRVRHCCRAEAPPSHRRPSSALPRFD